MYIRRPSVAGSFYPETSKELTELMNSFLKNVKDKKEFYAGVAPHAGYVYCGKVFASLYGKLLNSFDTVIVVGPNHYGKGSIDTCECLWQTPIGSLSTDMEIVELLKKHGINSDYSVHMWEHSIEVQIPWIIKTMGNVKFVPISVNPLFFEYEKMKELGDILYDVVRESGKKVFVVASSDFTHYGKAYNYVPFSGSKSEILEKIKELDFRMIKAIKDLAVERIIELGDEMTVCGYGPIAAVVRYAKRSGLENVSLEYYDTSFSVSKNTDAIVSYSGISFSYK